MTIEPSIGTKNLIEILQKEYGITIAQFSYLQRGWGGDCYLIECATREHLFLKIHNETTSFDTAASSRSFYLPLMYQLHAKGILQNIPHPIPTLKGELSLSVSSFELVITNFIEGHVIGFGVLPANILAKLAEQVGILHRSRTLLSFNHPFIERFEIIPDDDFLNLFDMLNDLTIENRAGQLQLGGVLLPQKNTIYYGLDNLKAAQDYARNAHAPKVICHTDLHGANLMTDNKDTLYILDWENAMIAPMEHDMIFFAGESNFWEVFWPHYTSRFGDAKIDCELLRFYFYRRSLEDIIGIALRILKGDDNEDRDQSDLSDLVECLAGLESIEETIFNVRRVGQQNGMDVV